MSFDVICSGCGSISGPSVGTCPFCKTVMISKSRKDSPQENSIHTLFDQGKMDTALMLAKKMYLDTKSKSDASFLLLYAKILLDTEGPSTQIKGLLAEAHLASPEHPEVLEYIELIDAKSKLAKGFNDAGEVQIKNLLRRSPNNAHANFILGAHIFWTDEDPQAAVPPLEACVRIAPNFLRAWGCLAAIYQKLGNVPLAKQAFLKCAELESDPKMKEYFRKQIA